MRHSYVTVNRNVTHHKSRDYDRINGFVSYKDPIIAANSAARRAADKEARLIKREKELEAIQDVWDALATRLTLRVVPPVNRVKGQVWNGKEYI